MVCKRKRNLCVIFIWQQNVTKQSSKTAIEPLSSLHGYKRRHLLTGWSRHSYMHFEISFSSQVSCIGHIERHVYLSLSWYYVWLMDLKCALKHGVGQQTSTYFLCKSCDCRRLYRLSRTCLPFYENTWFSVIRSYCFRHCLAYSAKWNLFRQNIIPGIGTLQKCLPMNLDKSENTHGHIKTQGCGRNRPINYDCLRVREYLVSSSYPPYCDSWT